MGAFSGWNPAQRPALRIVEAGAGDSRGSAVVELELARSRRRPPQAAAVTPTTRRWRPREDDRHSSSA